MRWQRAVDLLNSKLVNKHNQTFSCLSELDQNRDICHDLLTFEVCEDLVLKFEDIFALILLLDL